MHSLFQLYRDLLFRETQYNELNISELHWTAHPWTHLCSTTLSWTRMHVLARPSHRAYLHDLTNVFLTASCFALTRQHINYIFWRIGHLGHWRNRRCIIAWLHDLISCIPGCNTYPILTAYVIAYVSIKHFWRPWLDLDGALVLNEPS